MFKEPEFSNALSVISVYDIKKSLFYRHESLCVKEGGGERIKAETCYGEGKGNSEI